MNFFDITTNKFLSNNSEKVHYILCLKNNILIQKGVNIYLINSLGIVDKEFTIYSDKIEGTIYFNNTTEKISVKYTNKKLYKNEEYYNSILQNNSLDSFSAFQISNDLQKDKGKSDLSSIILALGFPLYCISDASGDLVLIYTSFLNSKFLICIFHLDTSERIKSKYIYSDDKVLVNENIDF